MVPFFGAVFLSLAVAWASILAFGWPRTVVAQPVKTASWLKDDKHQERITSIPVTTIPYRLDPPVQKAAVVSMHERATLPWSCETIRQATAKLTPEQIARLARVYRLTDKQKAEARRCLNDKRAGHDPRCDGPARYEAMREAFEAGRPQPC